MDFIALIEQAGLRILNGHSRVSAALRMGHPVMACDGKQTVFRIAIEDNALVVAEVPDALVDRSMVIVMPVGPFAQQ